MRAKIHKLNVNRGLCILEINYLNRGLCILEINYLVNTAAMRPSIGVSYKKWLELIIPGGLFFSFIHSLLFSFIFIFSTGDLRLGDRALPLLPEEGER